MLKSRGLLLLPAQSLGENGKSWVAHQHRHGVTIIRRLLLQLASFWTAGRKYRPMAKQVEACCSSPASICYWFVASLVAWGVLSVIGIYWRPLHAPSASGCLFAMAIGCFANWTRNRTFHCGITGPLFLIAGIVFLLAGERMPQVNAQWVWTFVVIGTAVAFLLEWRYAKRSAL